MRVRRPSFTVLIWMLMGLVALVGMLYIELTREVTEGTVLARNERIEANLTGSNWRRKTDVMVRFQADDRTYERWVRIDTGTFDRLDRGSSLSVRYAPVNPDWVRPASQSTIGSLLADIDLWSAFTVLVLAGGGFVAFRLHRDWGLRRWWMLRRSVGRRILVLAAIVLWVQIIVTGYFLPPWPAFGSEPRDATVEARIHQVTTITQIGGGHRDRGDALPIGLPKGFDRVELSFVPDGWSNPVIAVDEVNEGSAGQLHAGTTVPARYSPDNPRNAQLEAGERSHRWKNPMVIHGTVSLIAIVALLSPLAVRWFRGDAPPTITQRRG